jgi:hypothetical protein
MVSVRVLICVIVYFAGIILAMKDKHKEVNNDLVIVS